MIVGEDFIFIHNPRCGGKVLRTAVEEFHVYPTRFWQPQYLDYFGTLLDFAHLRLWEVATVFPDLLARIRSGPSVVFVRNPMDRFISALNYYFSRRDSLNDASLQTRLEVFRAFVKSELSPQRILNDPSFVHFSRQKWFCALNDDVVVPHILPFDENPLLAVQELLGLPVEVDDWHEPPSPDECLRDDPVLSQFAHEYYAPDYEFFNRFPHLRHLADLSIQPSNGGALSFNHPSNFYHHVI